MRPDFAMKPRGRKRTWKRLHRGNTTPHALQIIAGSQATLRQLADMTQLPIMNLSRYFNGVSRVPCEAILAISDATGCDAYTLCRLFQEIRRRRQAKISAAAAGQTPPAAAGPHPENVEPVSPARGGEQASGRGTSP